MQILTFFIVPLIEGEAREIVRWHYSPPYDLYNIAPDDHEATIAYFLNPENHCYAIREADGTFLGYGSLGVDAQVPGGDYQMEALDLGIGIRPELTGQGEGKRFLAALVAFAKAQDPAPPHLRVTVAGFNERAQRLVRGGGFTEVQRFTRPADGVEFVVFLL
jgi:ribosomal-protein-alanine N-acetyltransferase